MIESNAAANVPLASRLARIPVIERASARGAELLHRRLAARAVDVTAEIENRSCLVIAPHPDDETLGCGATIARKTASGTKVSVIVVTDGRHANPSAVIGPDRLAEIRETEAKNALAKLGVTADCITFLGIEDGTADDAVPDVSVRIAEVIAAATPAEVYMPSAIDGHSDHRAVFAASTMAVEQSGHRVTARSYPIWFWDPRAWIDKQSNVVMQTAQLLTRPPSSLRNLHVQAVAMGEFRRSKREALDEYRSQLTRLSGEESWPTMSDDFLGFFFGDAELFFMNQ